MAIALRPRVLAALLLVCFACVCTHAQSPTDLNSAFVWQGFRHAWERTTLSFKTPHRLGSFANYIHDETFSDGSAKAHSTVTYTPGVNGDFAFPATYYGLVSSSGAVEASRSDVTFSLRDNATDSSGQENNPTASLDHVVQWSVPAMEGVEPGSFGVLLRGFKIGMHCDPAAQPVGGECNSNGVWPSLLRIALEECELSGDSIACNVRFQLNRGNIPFHYRLSKPFNYVMDYNVTIGITVLQSSSLSTFSVSYAPDISVGEERAFPASPVSGTAFLQGGGNGYFTSAISGIRGLSLELNKTLDVESLGRYLESFESNLEDLYYDPVAGKQQVAYSIGISTTVTVVPLTYSAAISPVLLQFSEATAARSTSISNGTICFSDQAFPFTFQCRLKGMKPSTTDEVSLSFN
eukprot:TRINITY_DN5036_c0_g1_i1.p1 TRINITY_DN5036_c0_g1~~TRINITY_DN5036_c0_g1_i1.p1  ORF type:complete len:407 (-),score=113.41 TRINITY_DN5036_c0_g1_i1:133-1353(-)